MHAARKQNIILSGFMATGKSTVGRRLAVALGYDFLDVDTLIAAEAGMPISQVFATRGRPPSARSRPGWWSEPPAARDASWPRAAAPS
jgi:hypothetical protein